MEIKLIGLPSKKTERMLLNVRAAASQFEHRPTIHWINDIHELAEMRRFASAAIFINNKCKVTGRIPSIYEITSWIEEEFQRQEQAMISVEEKMFA